MVCESTYSCSSIDCRGVLGCMRFGGEVRPCKCVKIQHLDNAWSDLGPSSRTWIGGAVWLLTLNRCHCQWARGCLRIVVVWWGVLLLWDSTSLDLLCYESILWPKDMYLSQDTILEDIVLIRRWIAWVCIRDSPTPLQCTLWAIACNFLPWRGRLGRWSPHPCIL